MFGRRSDYQHSDGHLEIASLETDIMRFLAIIGFCLMIIFALVQSIPVSSSEVPLKEAEFEKQKYKEQVNQLNDRLNTLLIENSAIVKNQQLTYQAILRLNADIHHQKEKLKGLAFELAKRYRKLNKLLLVNSKVKDQLSQQNKQLIELKETQTKIKNKIQKVADRKQQTKDKSEGKGMTLRFNSNQLFQTLVLESKVGLYVKSAEGFLKYRQGSFSKEPINQSLYGLNEETVPETFLTLANSHEPGIKRWYVSLPKTTEQHIHRLMATKPYGEIVIGQNAAVHFET